MPWIIAVSIGLLAKGLESLIGRVIIALGVGVVTATGIDLALSAMKAQTVTALTGIPSQWAQLLGLADIDICASMLMGAVISAFGVRAVAGSLTWWKFRPTI